MHQGWSRTISGLLTLATLVFAGFIVRDAQGADVATSPSIHLSATFVAATVSTPTLTPSPGSVITTQPEKRVTRTGRVATPVRKFAPAVTVTPTVTATQTIVATPTMAPSVMATPVSTPVATSTPRPRGVSYAITGGGADVRGEIETQGESVGALTKRIATERGVSFVYEASDMGWFVTEIAGVKQDPRSGYYWLFYVNGQLSNRGADAVQLHTGDTLTWKYERI